MDTTIRRLVPMAHVRNVTRSIEFYGKLGFIAPYTHTPEGSTEPVWAWLESGAAAIMVARAGEPVDPRRQAVLFYLYCDDVRAFRDGLAAAGVAAGEICTPFYSPRGEFRVEDPDGYVLMISHT